jgi:hypothetical protein
MGPPLDGWGRSTLDKSQRCKEVGIMVIVIQMAFPPESANQIAKRFIETPPIPDYMTRRGPYVSSELTEGVHTLTIYEMDNEKLTEGLVFLSDLMTTYFGVPGFKYTIRQYLETEEALKLLGM